MLQTRFYAIFHSISILIPQPFCYCLTICCNAAFYLFWFGFRNGFDNVYRFSLLHDVTSAYGMLPVVTGPNTVLYYDTYIVREWLENPSVPRMAYLMKTDTD